MAVGIGGINGLYQMLHLRHKTKYVYLHLHRISKYSQSLLKVCQMNSCIWQQILHKFILLTIAEYADTTCISSEIDEEKPKDR